MLANDLGLEFAMIHNRHKKSLKQLSPAMVSRRTSQQEEEDSTADIIHAEEDLPEELRLTQRQVDMYLKISGNVAGMNCILVDDMIDTGSTVRLALEVLNTHNAG